MFGIIGQRSEIISELEMQLNSYEQTSKTKKELLATADPETGDKIKELEKVIKSLKQEKDLAQKDKFDAEEKLKLQDKELKDALSQRKLAMAEYNEVTDR